MDQVHVIRHKVLVEGPRERSVARELGVSRNTVRKYMAQAVPRRGGERAAAEAGAGAGEGSAGGAAAIVADRP